MSNNSPLMQDMEFEQRLNEMGDNQPELIRFIARQQYRMAKLCPVHEKKIKALENKDRKQAGAIGGIGAIIGAIMAGIVDYFMRR